MEVPKQVSNSENSNYEDCSICYDSFTNKAYTNECLHSFCYECIVSWTKVKAVCPLCVTPVTKILHNIRSISDYDIYNIVQLESDEPPSIGDDGFLFDSTDTDSSYGDIESVNMDSDFDHSFLHGDFLSHEQLGDSMDDLQNMFDQLHEDDYQHNDSIYEGDEEKDENSLAGSDLEEETTEGHSNMIDADESGEEEDEEDEGDGDDDEEEEEEEEEEDTSEYCDAYVYENHNVEHSDNSTSEYEEEFEHEDEISNVIHVESEDSCSDEDEDDDDENLINEDEDSEPFIDEDYGRSSVSCSDDEYECYYSGEYL